MREIEQIFNYFLHFLLVSHQENHSKYKKWKSQNILLKSKSKLLTSSSLIFSVTKHRRRKKKPRCISKCVCEREQIQCSTIFLHFQSVFHQQTQNQNKKISISHFTFFFFFHQVFFQFFLLFIKTPKLFIFIFDLDFLGG